MEQSPAQQPPSSAAPVSLASIADQIAGYAEPIADEAGVPAIAIGLITKNGLVEERYLGRNHAGDAITAQTLFEIGSSTKAFLGVTEAILVERGDLAWDDRVIDHYPEFEMHDPWVTREFRIDDLIAQRTGLREYASELAFGFGHPWSDNVRALRYLAPEASFRSTFAYQNVPHYVAGEIVAGKVGAKDWNEAVAELVFDPLEMTNSSTAADALAQSDDTTRGYTKRDGSVTEYPLGVFPSIAQGAGSIVSNLQDMSKWIAMHLNQGEGVNGPFLSAQQLRTTYAPKVTVSDPHFLELTGFGNGAGTVSYATGWFVHALAEGQVIEHGGNTEGYNAAVLFDPDREIGLVVLSNQGYEGGAASHIGKYGMDLVQGRTPQDYFARQTQHRATAAAAEKAEMAASRADQPELASYEGAYAHEMLGTLVFEATETGLRTRVGPQQSEAVLERKTGHRFEMKWEVEDAHTGPAKADVVFDVDGDGERPRHVTVQGYRFVRTSE